jgi:hypothetical protein
VRRDDIQNLACSSNGATENGTLKAALAAGLGDDSFVPMSFGFSFSGL